MSKVPNEGRHALAEDLKRAVEVLDRARWDDPATAHRMHAAIAKVERVRRVLLAPPLPDLADLLPDDPQD